jgi:ketopantoate hydroxymethyltransferase
MSKITIHDFVKKKAEQKKYTMLTDYDFTFAKIVDEASFAIRNYREEIGNGLFPSEEQSFK